MALDTLGAMLAPRYLIVVEGTKLKEDITQFISSVEYHEEQNSASKITLQVMNPNFVFLDERVFAEGNTLDLWMGYAGKALHFMNRGTIVKPDPSFPRSGMPRLTIVAHDASRLLMDTGAKDKGKVYRKVRDSDVVSKIFKEEGFAPFVFQTKPTVTRVRKKGTTRWQFLQDLASYHSFVCWVRWDPEKGTHVGYWGPPDVEDQPTKHKFIYGTGEPDATLLDFDPKMSLPSQTTKLEVQYLDPKTRKFHRIAVEVKKKDAEKTRFAAATGKEKLRKGIPNGPSVVLTVFGQREEVVMDRRFTSAADCKRWAQAWFERRQNDFVFGRGAILGSPDVRLGHVHELKGLGPRFSGDWQMTAVTQKMGEGALYETEFSANKVALKSVVGTPRNISGAKQEEADA
jgi:phage protein D